MTGDDFEADPAPSDPSFADRAYELFVAAHTGLPPQVQRNLFKAVGGLVGAGADVGRAWLNGQAKLITARKAAAVSDIKAKQKAANLITQRKAEVIAQGLLTSEPADRATQYEAEISQREQLIREDVLRLALEQMEASPPKEDASAEIDGDWIFQFYKEASKRSAEEFRLLFARILSGEMTRPGSFSIGTLQSLSRLTKPTAEAFQAFCNASSTLGPPRVIADPFGPASNNSLSEFGLSYPVLARLTEEGLVRSDFQEWQDVPRDPPILFEQAGTRLLIESIEGHPAASSAMVRISGPAFTNSGAELRQVVTMASSAEYLRKLSKWFLSNGVRLKRVIRIEAGRAFTEEIPPSA